MEQPITIHTTFQDYSDTYNGEYFDYFQIHTYSMAQIISTYYHPEFATIKTVTNAVDAILETIKERSGRRNKITLFQKKGKFLIAKDSELIDQ
jgi:hypothetical protein